VSNPRFRANAATKFNADEENSFRNRVASFNVWRFPLDGGKHLVTDAIRSDRNPISSGWSDRHDRANCCAATQ
jgi:hypothetical protein